MTTIEAGQSVGLDELDNIVWQAAEGMRSPLEKDGERVSAATLLDELEKHQLWLELDNRTHPDREPTEGTLGSEELLRLAELRRIFPTIDDIESARPYTRNPDDFVPTSRKLTETQQKVADHLLRRVLDANENGDVKTFEYATSMYEELMGQ